MFRIADLVHDKYLVSSVGEYVPRSSASGKWESIGLNRLYETMVFRVTSRKREACGCPSDVDWSEIDFLGAMTVRDALANHNKLLAKYRRKAKPPNRKAAK